MPNLPNYDYTNRLIQTWSAALLGNASVLNGAWLKLTDPASHYGAKELVGDLAKCMQLNFDAAREALAFDGRRVEWRQVSLEPGQKAQTSFDVSVRLSDPNKLRVTKPAALGGGTPGSISITPTGVSGAELTFAVAASSDARGGEQWIAFVYEALAFGPPLGVVLVMVEEAAREPEQPAAEQLADLAAQKR